MAGWRVAVGLALAQLRHRPARWALLAAGLALMVAVPFVSAGMATVVAAQTVRRTAAGFNEAQRDLLVTQDPGSVFSVGTRTQIDAVVRTQLGRLTANPVRSELVYRQLSVNGTTFFLAGTDRLTDAVALTGGRMPVTCAPARCEVLVIGSADAALTAAARTLGVVVVGQARRVDPVLVSGQLDTGGAPLLVADGAVATAGLASLQLFARTYAWTARLDVDRVVRLGVPAYVRRGAEVGDTLSARVGGTNFYRPDDQLRQQDERAAASARRFGLLGAGAAVLMLGFAVIAAVAVRREHTQLCDLLRRRGAGTGELALMTGAETVLAGAAGAALGAGLGAAVTAVLARQAGLGTGATLLDTAARGAVPAAVVCVAAVTVCAVVLLWPPARARSIWQAVDLVGVGCLGAVLLAAGRGPTTASAGGDPLIVALPVLSAVLAGLLAARLWSPAVGLVARLLPPSAVVARIALTGSIRRPLRALTSTAFLAAAVAAVVFGGAYRATLLAASQDQAAYAVPLEATVGAGPGIADPLAIADPDAVRAALPGAAVYPVTRTSVSVAQSDGTIRSVPVLGVDAAALSQAHRWNRVTGATEPVRQLQQALTRFAAGSPPVLPPAARRIRLPATGVTADVSVTLWLRAADGRQQAVPLAASPGLLSAALPDLGSGPVSVVAVTAGESTDYATHHQHAIGEGSTDQPVLATALTLGAPAVDTAAGVGAPGAWSWTGWGSAQGAATATGPLLRVPLRLQNSVLVAVPGFASSPAPLPIAADPGTAALGRAGRLTLRVGNQSVPAVVVAVLPRLPAAGTSFILADRAALAGAFDRLAPSAANPSQLWIEPAPHRAAELRALLARPPYDRLTVTDRAVVAADLLADPVGQGSSRLLLVVDVLALAAAALALVLFTVGERRDGAGELYAWESDGLAPATLRRVLSWRSVTVIGIAVPVGVAGGLALARAGVGLVAVDAAGATPVPPLALSSGSWWTVAVLLVGLGGAAVTALAVVSRTLREPLPARPETDLR